MSPWLIILTGAIYAYIALENLIRYRNTAMFIIYGGYALSNIGLYQMAIKG